MVDPIPERWRTDLTAQTVWSSEGGPMICQTCEQMAYPPERAKALARRIATLPDIERQRDRLLEAMKAAAVMPWGYCICPPRMGDMEGKDDRAHCGECRDVRAAIALAVIGRHQSS